MENKKYAHKSDAKQITSQFSIDPQLFALEKLQLVN